MTGSAQRPLVPVQEALVHGEPLDLRLLLPCAAAWTTAWLATGWSARTGLGVSVVSAVIGVALLARRATGRRPRRTRRRLATTRRAVAITTGAAALCASGASAAVAWRLAAIQRGPLPALARDHAKVTLDLVVASDPEVLPPVAGARGRSRPLVILSAKATRLWTADGGVRLASPVFVLATSSDWSTLQPSQHMRAAGRLAPPKPGEFETAAFDASGSAQLLGSPSLLERWAGRLRSGLRDAAGGLPAGARGLLPGLVDGDTSELPPGVAADFKATGLTHLVAVSGANVAIVLGATLAVARLAGLRVRGQAFAALVSIAGFVVVARPSASVLRAAAMGVVAVIALVSGRRRRGLPALCAAALVLIFVDPTLARSLGFALSACATGSLLVLAPVLRDRWVRRLPRWLSEALAVPTAASLACAPLIVAISGRISLSAVPANLLAEPAVAPATICGVLAACLAPMCPPLAHAAAALAGVPCTWLVFVAHSFARLPGSSVRWLPGPVGAAGLAAVIAAGAASLAMLRGPTTSDAAARDP